MTPKPEPYDLTPEFHRRRVLEDARNEGKIPRLVGKGEGTVTPQPKFDHLQVGFEFPLSARSLATVKAMHDDVTGGNVACVLVRESVALARQGGAEKDPRLVLDAARRMHAAFLVSLRAGWGDVAADLADVADKFVGAAKQLLA